MAIAVTVAADPAAPATEQVQDNENDEDCSKRHGVPPRRAGWRINRTKPD
jgi:hypothetical protein